MISQISITSIDEIVHEIQRINYSCNELPHLINGELKTQKINQMYKKIIIEKVSDNIKTIVVDCNSNKIKSIAFYGVLNIQPKDIFSFYKHYRQHYSVRDDLYFYFFNEERALGNYFLSFFTRSPEENGIKYSHEPLSNLMLSW